MNKIIVIQFLLCSLLNNLFFLCQFSGHFCMSAVSSLSCQRQSPTPTSQIDFRSDLFAWICVPQLVKMKDHSKEPYAHCLKTIPYDPRFPNQNQTRQERSRTQKSNTPYDEKGTISKGQSVRSLGKILGKYYRKNLGQGQAKKSYVPY